MELQAYFGPLLLSSALIALFATGMVRAVSILCKKQHPPHQQQSVKTTRSCTPARSTECQPYKELYFKLHNIEDHCDVLPIAKDFLLSLLSEALLAEKNKDGTILSIGDFSAQKLDAFVRAELDEVVTQWKGYLHSRKNGQRRELFEDLTAARHWLVEKAPLKLVDGAWLGHVHSATMPFAYRPVTRAAWQVLSEELGDGELAKCHVYLYAQLLSKIDAPTPTPDSEEFTRHPGMDDVTVWRSALAQLLISLFAEDFLPEILGFNLNFEMMTLDTLVTAKELREVGVDPYYFMMHITIDNADTGHTAMASRIVADYMSLITSHHGNAAAQQAWRRIQAGYILSKNIVQSADSNFNSSIVDIFMAKAAAADGVHDTCPIKIGSRKLSHWLDPTLFRERKWQAAFLKCLGDTKPWVYKGNSSRSRLVHQISWGGSMFGAFTDRELSVVKDWIDSLSPPGPEAYEAYCGRKGFHKELTAISNFRCCNASGSLKYLFDRPQLQDTPAADLTFGDITKVDLNKMLPIWFAHTCLLESFVSVPWRVSNSTGCAIVRLLRAQYGFLPEPELVHGTDEQNRSGHTDLVGMGVEMFSRIYPECPHPGSLEEVLKLWQSPFAEAMAAASWKPREFQWLLLGIAKAFVKLHEAAASSTTLLSEPQRVALRAIAERERDAIDHCVQGVGEGTLAELDFAKGYNLGLGEIMGCLGSEN